MNPLKALGMARQSSLHVIMPLFGGQLAVRLESRGPVARQTVSKLFPRTSVQFKPARVDINDLFTSVNQDCILYQIKQRPIAQLALLQPFSSLAPVQNIGESLAKHPKPSDGFIAPTKFFVQTEYSNGSSDPGRTKRRRHRATHWNVNRRFNALCFVNC